MKNTNFGENVKLGKLFWFLFFAERITFGRFGNILSARVFIKNIQSGMILALPKACPKTILTLNRDGKRQLLTKPDPVRTISPIA
jgi:hypothetical protein